MADQTATIGVQLQGQMQTVSGLNRISSAMEKLGLVTDAASAAQDRYRRRGFLANQMLFTARRALYGTSIALTGFAVASVKMGFAFNSSMEQNTVAMTQFLGSTQAAKDELNHLYQVAAVTPFEFTNIVDTTRRFLAFGFSLKETNRMLNIMGDTAAAMGGGVDTLQRMALVFGQMHAAGRVLGQDMLQLEQIGLPVLDILKEQLGLTQAQVAHIGQLHIPADIAIEAIMRGLNERFKGQAAAQAKTLQGRISTLHDYAAKMFGALTLPLYNKLRDDIIPKLTDLAQSMQTAATQKGFFAALTVFQDKLGLKGPLGINLVNAIKEIVRTLKWLWQVLTQQIIPTFKFWAMILSPFIILLLLMFRAFQWLTKQWWFSKPIISALILLFIAWKTVGMAVAIVNMWLAFTTLVAADTTEGLTVAMVFAKGVAYAYMYGLMAVNFVLEAMPALLVAARTQMAVLNIFIETSLIPTLITLWELLWPVGLIVLIVVGLTVLYFKWKWFHDFVNSSIEKIKRNWKSLLFILGGGFVFLPITVGIVLVIHYFKLLKGIIMDVINLVKRLVGWISHIHFPHIGLGLPFGLHVPHLGWPHMATGGEVMTAGVSVVGERGPEALYLPRGASVQPLGGAGPLGGIGGIRDRRDDRPIVVQMIVDGKVLAQAVAKAKRDQAARR